MINSKEQIITQLKKDPLAKITYAFLQQSDFAQIPLEELELEQLKNLMILVQSQLRYREYQNRADQFFSSASEEDLVSWLCDTAEDNQIEIWVPRTTQGKARPIQEIIEKLSIENQTKFKKALTAAIQTSIEKKYFLENPSGFYTLALLASKLRVKETIPYLINLLDQYSLAMTNDNDQELKHLQADVLQILWGFDDLDTDTIISQFKEWIHQAGFEKNIGQLLLAITETEPQSFLEPLKVFIDRVKDPNFYVRVDFIQLSLIDNIGLEFAKGVTPTLKGEEKKFMESAVQLFEEKRS